MPQKFVHKNIHDALFMFPRECYGLESSLDEWSLLLLSLVHLQNQDSNNIRTTGAIYVLLVAPEY